MGSNSTATSASSDFSDAILKENLEHQAARNSIDATDVVYLCSSARFYALEIISGYGSFSQKSNLPPCKEDTGTCS